MIRRGHYTPDERIRKRLPRILLSSAVMGAALFAAFYPMRSLFTEGHPLMLRALGLLGLVALGAVVYFVLAHFTHAMRWAELKKMVRR